MTIPSGARKNWCPACEETTDDHSRICTTCGTELQYPRVVAPTTTNSSSNNTNANALPPPPRAVNLLPVPSELTNEALNEASRELRERLGNIRNRIRETNQEQNELLREILSMQEMVWQDIPPAWLDPDGQQQTSNRPTSKRCLEQLSRIVLHDKSALFRRASLRIDSQQQSQSSSSMTAIPGEFGPVVTAAASPSSSNGDSGGSHSMMKVLSNACLIVANPRTGKGGRLSDETLQAVQKAHHQQQQKQQQSDAESNKKKNSTGETTATTAHASAAIVMYFERGDNITFVKKALMAQNDAGAVACLIGNNRTDPWPYTMKDSSQEAVANNLQIPVVMVKQSDGKDIVKHYNERIKSGGLPFLECTLTIEANDATTECVVCRDRFEIEQTVIQLPTCCHVFHEKCALMWLESHNTCPYCRLEFPTDDEEYERTRRQEQRTHAGSQGTDSTFSHEYYG